MILIVNHSKFLTLNQVIVALSNRVDENSNNITQPNVNGHVDDDPCKALNDESQSEPGSAYTDMESKTSEDNNIHNENAVVDTNLDQAQGCYSLHRLVRLIHYSCTCTLHIVHSPLCNQYEVQQAQSPVVWTIAIHFLSMKWQWTIGPLL